jgi:hypothetical protein
MAFVPLNPSQPPTALMGFCFERLPILNGIPFVAFDDYGTV